MQFRQIELSPSRVSFRPSPWQPALALPDRPAARRQPRCSRPMLRARRGSPSRPAGFSQPACGVVYRMKDEVSCGMPLGGIDTGCIDLETSGLLGFCTIFNTHVPRRGPINLPILGLSVGGKTWVLCDKQPKKAWREKGVPYGKPVIPVLSELKLEGVETAKQIHYWGHYPVADLEFETDAPIQVGLRAWSPFLPGDLKASMMPAAVFEVHLRNPGKNAADRHDRVFLPRARSEGGGHEAVLAEELTGRLRRMRPLRRDEPVRSVIDRSRVAGWPPMRSRSSTARDASRLRRRAGRRRGRLGEDRQALPEGTRRPARHVGGRRFLAPGRQREDRAVRSGLVRPDLERHRLQLGNRIAEALQRLAADVHPHVRQALPECRRHRRTGRQTSRLAAAPRFSPGSKWSIPIPRCPSGSASRWSISCT